MGDSLLPVGDWSGKRTNFKAQQACVLIRAPALMMGETLGPTEPQSSGRNDKDLSIHTAASMWTWGIISVKDKRAWSSL